MADPVKLKNSGKRDIDGLKPEQVGLFEAKQAKKLLRLFPKELTDLDNVKVDYDATTMKDLTGKKAAKGKDEEPEDDDAKLAEQLKTDKK